MKKLKNILAWYHINKLKKKIEQQPINFPDDLMTPKRILICLPSSLRELTLVKQFLPTITSLFKPADLTLLAIPGVKVADIYPRKGFQILTPSMDQLTWSGLPKRTFIQMLQGYNFEMLLDLNFAPSIFTSAVLLNFPQAIRVGRGNHRGIPFYNLEIKTKYLRDERNIYRSLLETLAHITNKQPEIPRTNNLSS
ncbi:MAG: hypothetical protein JXA92_10200 [candidate division Zixibacteria bacterium]|nr:hypothetical protein [candidate division Zixibacteria bacterium]